MKLIKLISIVFAILVSFLAQPQTSDSNSKQKKPVNPIIQIGLNSSIGPTYRILKSTGDYTNSIVEDRNQLEKPSFSTVNQILLSFSNSKLSYFKFNLGIGQNYIKTEGKRIHPKTYTSYGWDNDEVFQKEYSILILSNSLEFSFGKNRHFGGFELGALYQIQKNVHNGYNISPFISLNYTFQLSSFTQLKFGTFFTSQLFNNHFKERYYYISGYGTGGSGGYYPKYSSHIAEQERIWQFGFSFSILLNLKKSSQS